MGRSQVGGRSTQLKICIRQADSERFESVRSTDYSTGQVVRQAFMSDAQLNLGSNPIGAHGPIVHIVKLR